MTAGPQQSHAVTEEDTTSSSLPSFTITDQAFFAAMPKAVQVSVQIPRDYYEAVAEAQGVPRGEADAERQKFEAAVAEVERRELAKARATMQEGELRVFLPRLNSGQEFVIPIEKVV